jgi:hypothetical protein
MPSISHAPRPASAIAFRIASHAIDSVVRFDGRICGVSPTPTIQYLSVSAPIASRPFPMMFVTLRVRQALARFAQRGQGPGEPGQFNEPTFLSLSFSACLAENPGSFPDLLHSLNPATAGFIDSINERRLR